MYAINVGQILHFSLNEDATEYWLILLLKFVKSLGMIVLVVRLYRLYILMFLFLC